jgi:glycosyltransferase involved in cell wall biosynthesis
MRVALVHDYLNEYGGAERVLETLSEMYPEAPIYTAFYREGSRAHERFKQRRIVTSWAQAVPGFSSRLHSPLRFLAPLIWESFNLDAFDVVISSASWYITKGIITRPETVHICYCHTPPRYLYGYPTSVNWQKWWPVRIYAAWVNKGLREYDFLAAQRVDSFIANSINVQKRIEKYYRRDSKVIYPPVELEIQRSKNQETNNNQLPRNKIQTIFNDRGVNKDYYLIASRLVGGKGIEMAVAAANRLRVPLKVVGAGAGYSKAVLSLKKMAGETVEFLGFVEDEKLAELYQGAKAFLALAEDEDFGITPVEAMMVGTPVIAFNGGGYTETVIEGKTGVMFDQYSVEGLMEAIKKYEARSMKYDDRVIRKHAEQFSKQRFIKEMTTFVEEKWQERTQHRHSGKG